jgi:heat shock protein HtpX
MAAYGLYSHIRANRVRSVILIGGLFFLLLLLTYAGSLIAAAIFDGDAPLDYLLWVAQRNTLAAIPFVAVGTAIWLWIAWIFHQRMIDVLVDGHDASRNDEPRLYNLLENLCISRGIPMPKLKVVEDSALNAFATGLNQKQYAISVTRGLMERLNDAELEAVLGHELTHIRNGDVRMLVVAVVIAGVISLVGEIVFRGMFRSGARISSGSSDRKGGAGAAILIALAIVAIAWILSIVIRFALSRSREYLADAGAVELTKNPDAMISALRKIEGRGELKDSVASIMEMCVDNPHSGFVDIFSTHPTIEKRVTALVQAAGGRDPGPLPSLVESQDPLRDAIPEAAEESPPPAGERGPWDRRPAIGDNPLEPWQWGPWGPRKG